MNPLRITGAAVIAAVLTSWPVAVTAAVSAPEVAVSPESEEPPRDTLPGGLNHAGAYKGVRTPSGLKKYDRQAELLFFSNTFSGLPALALSGRREKHGFLLLAEYSKLPRIKDEGTFLRSAGVPVKSVTKETYINDPNGTSTATYTYDSISAFRTNTAQLGLFYYREVYETAFARAGLLAGIPLAWHSYAVSATLADGTAFDENGSALGLGAAAGVTATFGSTSVQHAGPVCSIFLLYDQFWFGGARGELDRHLQARLNGFRFGFSAGWRFSSY